MTLFNYISTWNDALLAFACFGVSGFLYLAALRGRNKIIADDLVKKTSFFFLLLGVTRVTTVCATVINQQSFWVFHVGVKSVSMLYGFYLTWRGHSFLPELLSLESRQDLEKQIRALKDTNRSMLQYLDQDRLIDLLHKLDEISGDTRMLGLALEEQRISSQKLSDEIRVKERT